MNSNDQLLSLDDVPEAMIATTSDGLVLFWNKSAEKLFGYTGTEVSDQPLSNLVIPKNLLDEERSIRETIIKDGSHSYEATYQRKGGSLLNISISAQTVQKGETTVILSTLRDVTRLNVAQINRLLEARFGNLLESMPDGIVMANSVGRIVLANSQAEKMFGYGHGELLAKPIEDLIPPRLRGSHIGHRAGYVERPRPRAMGAGLELFGLRQDGSEFPVEISLSPFQTESGTLVMSAVRDITDRKQIESELREKNIALESANQELEAFSYTVSHDLRAPLRAMGGFARILESRFPANLPAEAIEAVGRIRHNAMKMGQLVDGLLDFSSLGRRALTKARIQPSPVVQAVFDELKSDQGSRAIEFELQELPACSADPTLLRQVFANLLSNAIKYSRDRNPARIKVGSLEEEGRVVYFVQDNGDGFDMEFSSKLFKVFQRLHRSDQFEGTGVGLAIVQRIVQRHGGRIWADGRENHGATFFFTLE